MLASRIIPLRWKRKVCLQLLVWSWQFHVNYCRAVATHQRSKAKTSIKPISLKRLRCGTANMILLETDGIFKTSGHFRPISKSSFVNYANLSLWFLNRTWYIQNCAQIAFSEAAIQWVAPNNRSNFLSCRNPVGTRRAASPTVSLFSEKGCMTNQQCWRCVVSNRSLPLRSVISTGLGTCTYGTYIYMVRDPV